MKKDKNESNSHKRSLKNANDFQTLKKKIKKFEQNNQKLIAEINKLSEKLESYQEYDFWNEELLKSSTSRTVAISDIKTFNNYLNLLTRKTH